MDIREMTGAELVENIGKMTILDVRTKEEFDEGHIEGAINIPYDEVLDHLDELDKNEPMIIHCRTNQRSEIALRSLAEVGYDDLYLAPGVALYDYDLVK